MNELESNIRNHELTETSGSFATSDLLIQFLYELMRDHVTPGVVEKILRNCGTTSMRLSNGFLAKYAENVANQLRVLDNSKALDKLESVVTKAIDYVGKANYSERVHKAELDVSTAFENYKKGLKI